MKVLNGYGITKKENGVENVRNSKVSQEEDKLIQQKLQEAFGYTDEQLAAQLDQAAAEYAAHPELNFTPPKGEFEKILAMAAQDETQETQDKKEDGHKVIRLKKVMKPMILVATVGAILWGTGMMASGRRYYRFWGENRGKGEIVFNNVDAISEADSLEKAYKEIESQTGIKAVEMFYVPEELNFVDLTIDRGTACISLEYNKKVIYFYQVLKENANSIGYSSDRMLYKELFNRYLQKNIKIYKKIIDDKDIEFSAQYMNDNAFYYLVGIVEKQEFEKIVQNLNYVD